MEKAIYEYCERLQTQYRLYSAVLFGSRAEKSNNSVSDWDILFIIEGLEGNWLEKKYALSRYAPFQLDAQIFTRKEIKEELKKPNFLIMEAVVTGTAIIDDGTWKKICQEAKELMKKYEMKRYEDRWQFNPVKIPY